MEDDEKEEDEEEEEQGHEQEQEQEQEGVEKQPDTLVFVDTLCVRSPSFHTMPFLSGMGGGCRLHWYRTGRKIHLL